MRICIGNKGDEDVMKQHLNDIAGVLETKEIKLLDSASSMKSKELPNKKSEVVVINCHGGIADLRDLHNKKQVVQSYDSPNDNIPPDEPEDPKRLKLTKCRSGIMFGRELAYARDLEKMRCMPIVLCFSTACFSGWEPSLARAMLDNGCQYYIGPRVESAGVYTGVNPIAFFEAWKRKGFSAASVPAVFKEWATTKSFSFYPVLYTLREGQLHATVVASKKASDKAKKALQKILGSGTKIDYLEVKHLDIYVRVGKACFKD
jgi:hypothetical protein